MEYIVLDLEWNNGYCKQLGKPINEIIEIGALRVDDALNLCDSFKQLVTPELTKKLSGRVKKLTHITNEDVKNEGIPFLEAIDLLVKWVGTGETVFMTWSNTDLYILAETFQYYQQDSKIDFIHKYMDVQKYCQSFFTDLTDNNQISLLNAAIKLDVARDESALHRALADCELTAKCFIKCYDAQKLKGYIHVCDTQFFEKLMFKPYYITDPASVSVDLKGGTACCPSCQRPMRRISGVELVNNSFRTAYICKACGQKFYLVCRLKQQYDRVDIKKRIMPLKRAKTVSVQKDQK